MHLRISYIREKISLDDFDLSDILPTPKEQNEAFPSHPPSTQCCADVTTRINIKHPNFKWREQGMSADCCVLKSYTIQGQCLTNSVANFSYRC